MGDMAVEHLYVEEAVTLVTAMICAEVAIVDVAADVEAMDLPQEAEEVMDGHVPVLRRPVVLPAVAAGGLRAMNAVVADHEADHIPVGLGLGPPRARVLLLASAVAVPPLTLGHDPGQDLAAEAPQPGKGLTLLTLEARAAALLGNEREVQAQEISQCPPDPALGAGASSFLSKTITLNVGLFLGSCLYTNSVLGHNV
ncbi:hypothetical protein FRB93_012631 [Tulasnella sp. JGI-2019a]|nr:hypothetical protein FRB93_012631 [Tulasnella sp. JGI-2019a]